MEGPRTSPDRVRGSFSLLFQKKQRGTEMKLQIIILALALVLIEGDVSNLSAQIITGEHKIQGGSECFDFSQGEAINCEDTSSVDILFLIIDVFLVGLTEIIDMGEVAFDSVFWAPDSGYQEGSDWYYAHTYVVRTKEGHYAKFTATEPDEFARYGFKWAYQSNGTQNLDTVTGIENNRSSTLKPELLWLSSSFPNPFSGETKLRVLGPRSQYFTLRIYDIRGREVKTLIKRETQFGQFEIAWDGTDQKGTTVANGLYFVVLEVGKLRAFRKIILQR